MKKHIFILLSIVLIAIFLRFYKLDQNPPSLYWDEVSLGYNAFAIWTTGHDEHGEFLPITRFIAFGDYKPPGYIYSIIPFYAVLGISEFAVRTPSALAGALMVLLTYGVAYELTQSKKISLLASLFLCLSPWSLQLSRGAFEAHLAALFNLLAMYCFLLARRKGCMIVVSAIFFVAAFYTFNANRILAPLFVLFMSIIFFKDLLKIKKWIFISIISAGILLSPYLNYFQTRESTLRFQEVSIFTSLDIIKTANEKIASNGNAWWAKIIYNRRVYFAKEFLIHYFDNFKGEFLFISGDQNPRLSTQYSGELYLFELPLLMIGLYLLLKQKSKTSFFLFGWMMIAPIPAGMARETPHMLRIASILPTFQIISAIGGTAVIQWLRKKQPIVRLSFLGGLSLVVLFSLIYYQHHYWVHYPLEWSGEWQYGYKQMVSELSKIESNYDRIVVTESLGRPYIYFLFYNKINPLEYARNRKAERDWYGLWNVYGFGKYDFTNKERQINEKVLYVTTEAGIDTKTKLKDITSPAGKVIFEIGEKP